MLEKSKSFWKDSAILPISAVITKVFGAFFKIPLTNILGGTGMGYFSSAYGLLLPIYALSVTGLSASISQAVARSAAMGNFAEVKRIHRIGEISCGILGAILSVIIFVLAKPFSVQIAAQPYAVFSVLAIAPAALFGCLTAVERGYWEGLQNMTPTAVSQAIEALVKLGLGLYFCQWTLQHADILCQYVMADVPLTALAAAGAVLGVTVSTLAGWLYFGVRSVFIRQKMPKSDPKMTVASVKVIFRRLLYVMIPVALGSLVTNLTSLLDLVTMMRCLGKAQLLYPDKLIERFGALAKSTDFPAFVYGSFTGMAVTVFNLVPSVTNMLGKSALPSAAALWTKSDKNGIAVQSQKVVATVAGMAFPAAGWLGVLAVPVMEVLYRGRPEEAFLATQSLQSLLPGMVCLCLVFPLCSILQGIGKAIVPVECMLIGVAVKLAGNLILIPQPAFCVSGAGIATSGYYLIILLLINGNLKKAVGQPLKLFRKIWQPALAATGSTAVVWVLRDTTVQWNLWLSLGFVGMIGGIVYLGLLWILTGRKVPTAVRLQE
ncbi:MAG: polysaccharide biosynthesis C-terminal domain-containing protein [Ruminococcus sp.]|nr:polysaccharide biosynthesis C-terminal domain-containing protein [Ruminococcus sp.]